MHTPGPKAPSETVPDTVPEGSRFIRACLRHPVDRTPVWFLRQAGRYMQEYRDIRKHHTLVEICKQPELAAEVTITAAEKLGVDAAIIFADLLLPLEPMGLDFEFQAGEGPVVHHPVRTADDVRALRTDRAGDLAYVARAIEKVVGHFRESLGIIGFCGAPYTLASYMIEGGGSRNYIHTKQMMYRDPLSWRLLLDKLVKVLEEYCRLQVQAGADVIQIFDSWVGSLGLADYREYAFEASKRLVRSVQQMGVPVIYFGVETAGLLGEMASTGVSPSMRAGEPSATATQCRATSTPSRFLRRLTCWNCASRRFCAPPRAGPATSSILVMASSPPRLSRTSRPSCAW
jgi:uroporphyrinogen decarboxylase